MLLLGLLAPQAALLPARAQVVGGGKTLSARVRACPLPDGQVGTRSFGAALLATGASNLAGLAVDALVDSISKIRESKSVALFTLTEEEQSDLWAGRSCLYLYAYTDPLQSLLARSITMSDLEALRSAPSTPLFVVLRFASHPFSKTASGVTSRYLKPQALFWHYSSYLDRDCPLFRSCQRRDVALQLSIANPISPTAQGTTKQAVLFALAFADVRPEQLAARMVREQPFLWVEHQSQGAPVSNLEFTLLETSRPGALAAALASVLRGSKPIVQERVKVVVVPPAAGVAP